MTNWDYARVSWLDHEARLTCTDPAFVDQALAGLGTLYPKSLVDQRQDPADKTINLRLGGLEGRGHIAGRWLLEQLGHQGWKLFQVDARPSKRNTRTLFLTYNQSGYYHFRRESGS